MIISSMPSAHNMYHVSAFVTCLLPLTPLITTCFSLVYPPGLAFMALSQTGLNHTCHLAVSVSAALVVCLPHTILSTAYPKALFSVLYYSSCIPRPSALSYHLIPWITTSMQIFLSFRPPDFQSSLTHLQNVLQQISSWMTANLLTLNSSKTEFILIGLKQQLAKMHNSSLNTTHAACNRGFIFDEHLTLFGQISALSKSCYSHIRELRCIRRYLCFATSIVHSKLDYLNFLYYNLPESQINRPKKRSQTPLLVPSLTLLNPLTPLLFSNLFTGLK